MAGQTERGEEHCACCGRGVGIASLEELGIGDTHLSSSPAVAVLARFVKGAMA